MSAYHGFRGVPHGEERDATHYWRYAEKDAFHLDYVFVPREWTIRDVRVGPFEVWGKRSDHVPVIVDVA